MQPAEPFQHRDWPLGRVRGGRSGQGDGLAVFMGSPSLEALGSQVRNL